MVTGYHIEIGYDWAGQTTFEKILDVARAIPLKKLKNKCLEYGLKEIFDCPEKCKLDDYIKLYAKIPTEDATCTITEEREYADEIIPKQLMQLASSGNGHREEKEIIRKAFSILVLDECFKQRLAVSLIIA